LLCSSSVLEFSLSCVKRLVGNKFFDGEVECQTEMATYVLFTVHTDTDDDEDDDNDTLIFYSIDKALLSSIKCIVAVMHTKVHYAVVEITIDTNSIKIFDGLHWPLLDWKDHVIRAIRKCMLIDPFDVPSSAQFNADTAVYEIVG
jgi:hypothetical protein